MVSDNIISGLDRFSATDINADGRIEFQGAAARRRLRIAEHDADFFAKLIDENDDDSGAIDNPRKFPHGLTHETGVEADGRIPDFPVDFLLRHQRRDGIDDDDVDRGTAHERFANAERLLAVIRLRNQKVMRIDAQMMRVNGIERMLGIDKRRDAAHFLCFRNGMKRQRRLPGRFRPVNLDDTPSRIAADTDRDIERQRTRGNDVHIHLRPHIPQLHDGAGPEFFFNLLHRRFQRFFPILYASGNDDVRSLLFRCHVCALSFLKNKK